MKTLEDSAQNSKNHKNVSLGENISERAKKNDAFFSSFIDLIPARIYMNPDDRHNWMEIVSNQSRKSKNKNADDAPDENSQTNGKPKKGKPVQSDDEEEEEMEVDEQEDDITNQSEQGIIKPNRFDPRFFKTVSQILKDLEQHHQTNKRNIDLKSNLKRAKFNNIASAAQPKSTAIKVFNKSQNKSAKNADSNKSETTNGNEEHATTTTTTENGDAKSNGASKSKGVKRPSKFKEEKRANIKRQRYDSQSEPLIVKIDHSEANSTENRKPVFNKSGQVVYSKFDFTADKTINTKKNKDHKLTVANAKPKDYKKLLKKLQEEKEKKELFKQAEPEKASELELKSKWKSAIDKAAGVKIKDDVDLLKKSVKKLEKKKEKSRKNWDERKKAVELNQKKLQDKRKKNMDKRKEKNKENKMKKLKKKGRVLPGF